MAMVENKHEEALGKYPLQQKINLLMFFEDLAIMVNSKSIRKATAYYMFGYQITAIWSNSGFWHGMAWHGKECRILAPV